MKRAFTLIELLVVIAIIAILAAILFPVFAQAKAAAKKTSSLSNVKNISMAMIIYLNDADDKFPCLQYYEQNPDEKPNTCNLQRKWQDVVYPYIKNGRGNVGYGGLGAGDYDEGIFRAPSGAKMAGSSYAVHQDVFMDAPAVPWNGCDPNADPTYTADFRTFSQTNFENLADKVLMFERGDSGGGWGFLQYGAWQWDWNNWGYNKTDGTLQFDGEGDVRGTGGDGVGRDCDGGFNNGSDTWAYCSMFPRYRYGNSTPFAFFDGHAKTMNRSAGKGANASSQVAWNKNIIILEAVRPSWSSWYPY
jgi:prepilin-type N-terminal cleavage/methylation domain-containing protein/prepilin-type processing-associated H-X9-DG protein